jgi:hypothetical protein
MRKILVGLTAAILLAALPACSGGNGPDYTWLRTMHAVPDAPVLRARFENYVFLERMLFGTSTQERIQSLLEENGTSTVLTLDYVTPDNSFGDQLLALEVPVAIDSISTVVLAGTFDNIQPIIVLQPRRARPLDRLYFQFVHASPELGALDVYVTTPEVELTATAPVATVQPLGHSDSLEAPFGPIRIRLTQSGTLDVVMDSGEIEFAAVEDTTGPGAEWLFAITPSVAAGPSPVFLLANSGRSSRSLFDADTPALTRAIHAAAGVGLVDLEALTDPVEVLVDDLPFGARSALVPVPEGSIALAFRAADAPEEPLATAALTSVRGAEYVAALIDAESGGAFVLETVNSRSVITEARFRFAHLAAAGDLVSVYLTTSEEEPPSLENRVFFNQSPGLFSPQLTVTPGEYFITLTTRPVDDPANDEDPVLLGPVSLPLEGGDVFTLALFPAAVEGEPETLQIFDETIP